MWFLIGGLLLLALWVGDVGPVGGWHWGWILLPFACAAAWWAFADGTGLTQRRAIDKMEERKRARRQRDMEALGLGVKHKSTPRKPGQRATPAPPPAPRQAEPPPAEPPRRDPRL